MRIIKRYSNRKLYDTDSKKYITLEGLAELIKEGQEIQVVHNDTDEDLTSLTLSQIVYEGEKKKSSLLPKSLLTSLIRTTSTPVVGRLKKTVHSLTEKVLPQEFDENLDQILEEGSISAGEGGELKGLLIHLWQKNLERVNELIDQRIHSLFEAFHVPTKSDLMRIEVLITQLDAKVDRLLAYHEQEPRSCSSLNTSPVFKEGDQANSSSTTNPLPTTSSTLTSLAKKE
jgi:polyhydroxyalkanoate synthesis repressor PhaR